MKHYNLWGSLDIDPSDTKKDDERGSMRDKLFTFMGMCGYKRMETIVDSSPYQEELGPDVRINTLYSQHFFFSDNASLFTIFKRNSYSKRSDGAFKDSGEKYEIGATLSVEGDLYVSNTFEALKEFLGKTPEIEPIV